MLTQSDAMDLLHLNQVDGFCIVSSDSDYTGLTKNQCFLSADMPYSVTSC